MTPQKQIEVFKAGWSAFKWLARHAQTDCPSCKTYRRMVTVYDRRPDTVLDKRCALARQAHEQYRAVEALIATLEDGMECDLIDPTRPDIRCQGAPEWVLAERSRRNGEMIGYVIGCEPHVRHAEARAIVTGSPGTFSIEKMEGMAPEDAVKMR